MLNYFTLLFDWWNNTVNLLMPCDENRNTQEQIFILTATSTAFYSAHPSFLFQSLLNEFALFVSIAVGVFTFVPLYLLRDLQINNIPCRVGKAQRAHQCA